MTYPTLEFLRTPTWCRRKLRGGVRCGLKHAHPGRCTSVTFHCDACGEERPGRVHRHDGECSVCFLCDRGLTDRPRHAWDDVEEADDFARRFHRR